MDGLKRQLLQTDLGPWFWSFAAFVFGASTWAALAVGFPVAVPTLFGVWTGFALGVTAQQVAAIDALRDLLADEEEGSSKDS